VPTHRSSHALAYLLVVFLAAACSSTRLDDDRKLIVEPNPTSDFDIARAKWAAARPAKYEYTLAISCFCGPDLRRPVVVLVDGNTVVSRTFADDGKPVSHPWPELFVTVDGLFDVILDARNRNAASLVVTYDSANGLPRQVNIDYVAQMADEERYYSAGNLKAR
jgi:hypothetical protein